MRHQFVIIGGGSGGITVAARLKRRLPGADITVIEPSDKHYYQPFWTLVGAGIVPKEASERPEERVMPRGVTWVRDRVREIDPDGQRLTLATGRRVGYDALIVAPGLQIDWEKVQGLEGALGRDGVCSIYDYRQAETTWRMIDGFRGGQAVFTAPATPIKCGGAPQKIMFLAEETFERNGVRGNSQVDFYTGGAVIFGVKEIAAALEKVRERKGLDYHYKHDLREVRPGSREAVGGVLPDDRAGRSGSHGALRPAARRPPDERAGLHQAQSAGAPGRAAQGLDGGRSRDLAAPDLPERLRAGGRDRDAEREDRRGHPQAGTDPGGEPAGEPAGRGVAGAVRRVRFVPARDGTGEAHPRRVQLQERDDALVPLRPGQRAV